MRESPGEATAPPPLPPQAACRTCRKPEEGVSSWASASPTRQPGGCPQPPLVPTGSPRTALAARAPGVPGLIVWPRAGPHRCSPESQRTPLRPQDARPCPRRPLSTRKMRRW